MSWAQWHDDVKKVVVEHNVTSARVIERQMDFRYTTAWRDQLREADREDPKPRIKEIVRQMGRTPTD
ncbi:hypothetical protein H2201_007279 [Coniosporium apollinis]|uniref:Clr5 domain-containing protein n=1 Tax=Coniosporium apollinis TaxID=61459 RepID=A0ABQ9NJW7_9PEZI|nr:hypothetical protein H2201_007279 [Coniosporium apollinis]